MQLKVLILITRLKLDVYVFWVFLNARLLLLLLYVGGSSEDCSFQGTLLNAAVAKQKLAAASKIV